jgi:hypothetical protein
MDSNNKLRKKNEKFLREIVSNESSLNASSFLREHKCFSEIMEELSEPLFSKFFECSTPVDDLSYGLIILNNENGDAFFWEIVYMNPDFGSKAYPPKDEGNERKLLVQSIYERNAS